MSHYKPYPAYKDSGVEWLGKVPENWEIKRIRYLADLNPPVREDLQAQGELEVSFLPMEDIGEDGSLRLERTRPVGEVKSGYSYFEDGDIAFAKVTPCFENGKGAIMQGLLKGVGFGTTELTVLRPRASATPEFLNYAVQTNMFRSFGTGAMTGAGGLKRVPDEFTRNFNLATPSLEEQMAITKRLDRETARIDALITKKTRFIELLREKRQALITHVVTKGLDPNVKMKDSGVEWLGEVPEHWEVKSLKYMTTHIGSGKTPTGGAETYQDSGVIFLRSQNVYEEGLRLEDVAFISNETDEDMKNSRVLENDVLLNITGASIGRSCHVAKDIGPANVNQHVCIIRSQSRAFGSWIARLMASHVAQSQIDYFQNGAGREGLNFEQIGNMLFSFPPPAEAAQIVDLLLQRTRNLDALALKTVRSIELLKERRSALITAAVTGQIDLREAA